MALLSPCPPPCCPPILAFFLLSPAPQASSTSWVGFDPTCQASLCHLHLTVSAWPGYPWAPHPNNCKSSPIPPRCAEHHKRYRGCSAHPSKGPGSKKPHRERQGQATWGPGRHPPLHLESHSLVAEMTWNRLIHPAFLLATGEELVWVLWHCR